MHLSRSVLATSIKIFWKLIFVLFLGNTTGLYCNDLAHISMLPRKYALTLEEVVGIILSLFIIVIVVALFVVCKKFSSKRAQNRTGGRNLLIQNEFEAKEQIMMKPTRNGAAARLNNLELVAAREQDLPLLSQHRPSSVSPAAAETNFNYMDTLRSYGAAAEELETLPRIPHDYIQNFQKPVATVAPSVMSDRDMNLKDNYFKRQKSPVPDSERSSGYYRPNKLTVNLPSEGAEEVSVEDDSQRYHWDCSDWAGQLELPPGAASQAQSEVVFPAAIDPTRDIQALPEDDEETEAKSIASSECESQLGAVYPDASPMHQTNKSIEELLMINDMNFADDDPASGLSPTSDIPNIYDYKLHLNNYLPTYHLGSDQDGDEATPMLGRHPQPLPPTSPVAACQEPPGGRKPSGPLRGLILPGLVTNGQSSDRLCEIEDEEEEAIKRSPSPRVTRV